MGETRTTATGTTVDLALAAPADHDEIPALFRAVGRVPRVIDGEDVIIYWRELS